MINIRRAIEARAPDVGHERYKQSLWLAIYGSSLLSAEFVGPDAPKLSDTCVVCYFLQDTVSQIDLSRLIDEYMDGQIVKYSPLV